MATGRNEPCPCGSGRKYKRCCQGTKRWFEDPKVRGGALLLLIAVGLFIIGQMYFGSESSTRAERPPGPAPPGKVWSPEHGHWHDAR